MYRQSPGRNLRSKRLKMRHALQICLLLVVCFWLIYQLHHSHDKEKEFDGGKASLKSGSSSDELLRLGRKDIRPLAEEADDKVERNDESGEEDENKLEEEDDVEEDKIENIADDAIGGENEETNEDEQEKSGSEIDREEEFVGDEKEKEENNDNVTEETDSGTEKHKLEKEDSADESDTDGIDKSAHEAREEHYKADDASSAVSQDTHEKMSTKNEDEHPQDTSEVKDNIGSDGEATDEFQKGKDLNVETAKEGNKESNATTTEKVELVLDNSEDDSPPNGTITQGSEDNLTKNNSTNVARENLDASSLNVTESDIMLDHGTGNLNETTSKELSIISDVSASEKMDNSSLRDGNNGLVSNSTDQQENRDEESNSEHGPEKIITSTEASTEKNDDSDSEGERSDTSGNKIEENLESTDSKNHDEAELDAIDISDSNNPLEETNARTDLDTLPVIGSEQTNDDDDAAAE